MDFADFGDFILFQAKLAGLVFEDDIFEVIVTMDGPFQLVAQQGYKLRKFETRSRSAAVRLPIRSLPLAQFHPSLQHRFNADRSLNLSQVCLGDVLLHGLADLGQAIAIENNDTLCVWRATNDLNDPCGIFERRLQNRSPSDTILTSPLRSTRRLLFAFGSFAVKRRPSVTEEHTAGALLGVTFPRVDRIGQRRKGRLEFRLFVDQILPFQVHLFVGARGALVLFAEVAEILVVVIFLE